MPSISRTARKLKKAREIRTQKLKAQKLEAKKLTKKDKLMKLWMEWMNQCLTILWS